MNKFMRSNRIPRPKRSDEYIHVYKPKAALFMGESEVFKSNVQYKDWIPNDHCFVKHEEGWHILGITHPRPDDFINDYEFGVLVHSDEDQLFHCFGKGSFKSLMYTDSYIEEEHVLYPKERSDEAKPIHAPHVLEWDGSYQLVYGPDAIRVASTKDFYNFEPKGALFSAGETARDPNIFVDDDQTIYNIYAKENMVCYRTSMDFKTWSDEQIMYVNPYNNGTCESPFMIKREGYYYLFWCMWDESCGCYDNRTFVFGHEDINELINCSPLTILDAHAPEIIIDEDGDYFISSVFYPNNGVSVAPLEWE